MPSVFGLDVSPLLLLSSSLVLLAPLVYLALRRRSAAAAPALRPPVKRPPPPSASIPAGPSSPARSSTSSQATMSNRNQRKAIKEFRELTQTNDATAKHYLKQVGWEMQPAVNAYYEAGCATYGQPLAAFSEAKAGEWFDRYREMDKSGEQFGRDTIPRFCADIGIEGNDLVLFVFAWKCECEVFCRFTKAEFLKGLQHPDVRADTPDGLKAVLPALRQQLEMPAKFKDLFAWLFSYAKAIGSRGMSTETACGIWPLFLKSGPFLFEYCDEWIEFVTSSGKRQVNRDTWGQLLMFIQVVQADASLAGYDDNEAWPVLIDEFVTWLKENDRVHK